MAIVVWQAILLGRSYRSGDPCYNKKVILFSDKDDVPGIFKALSVEFEGKLSFGKVGHKETQLLEIYGVEQARTNPEPRTLDPGPWTLDPGPWTLDPKTLILDPWTLNLGLWTLTLDPDP